ncbi:MAG: TIGR00730 family Rossman fold protein [Emcibacter sp.]|nr:TIGR00730 family Rossman fold protein [Emcibacter sp.]
MKRICVYCGSSPGESPEYMEAARTLGRELVKRDITLVYGGAHVGIMGEIADTVLAAGGEVIGIMPKALADKEIAHNGLTELKVVGSMHERKAMMADLSDGFIALPGGMGTLEEIFEVLTWSQLGYHRKPCSLLNIKGYYDSLTQFLDHTVEEGFVKSVHRGMILIEDNTEKLLDLMAEYESPKVDKWIGRNEI